MKFADWVSQSLKAFSRWRSFFKNSRVVWFCTIMTYLIHEINCKSLHRFMDTIVLFVIRLRPIAMFNKTNDYICTLRIQVLKRISQWVACLRHTKTMQYYSAFPFVGNILKMLSDLSIGSRLNWHQLERSVNARDRLVVYCVRFVNHRLIQQ